MTLELAAAMVRQRLAVETPAESIANELVSHGWTEKAAYELVERVVTADEATLTSPAALVSEYTRHIKLGAWWLLGGLAITLFSAATSTEGLVLVAIGPILVGAFWLCQGVVGFLRAR
jgi:hypothetical protein